MRRKATSHANHQEETAAAKRNPSGRGRKRTAKKRKRTSGTCDVGDAGGHVQHYKRRTDAVDGTIAQLNPPHGQLPFAGAALVFQAEALGKSLGKEYRTSGKRLT